MSDEEIVRALVAAAGINPSTSELQGFVAAYPHVREMVELLHAVDAAREEDVCLTFGAAPTFADWERPRP